MKSPMLAFAAVAIVCLSPAVASADGHRHPLVGESPAPMQARTTDSAARDPATESLWMARQREELVAALVGLRVYDAEENRLGDVTAVLFAYDGGVDTLLVRVDETVAVDGRDVALPFDLVTTATGSDGKTVILVETGGEEFAGTVSLVGPLVGPPVGVDEIP